MPKERDLLPDVRKDTFDHFEDESVAVHAIEQVTAQARRTNAMFSLILCDIDHFTSINALYGRAAGDSLLLQLFVRICDLVPVEDVIWESARADLLVVARNCDSAQAYNLAQAIRHRVADRLFQVGHHPVMMTVSLGTQTFLPTTEVSASVLLDLVEEQLEAGKESGPDTVSPTIN